MKEKTSLLFQHLIKGVSTIPLNDCVHSKCNSKLVAVVVGLIVYVIINVFTPK